jgi:hypothetical protein
MVGNVVKSESVVDQRLAYQMTICSGRNISTHDLRTVNQIVKRFRVKREFAVQVVKYAHKYSKSTFPSAHDIVAIIGVESSFNPQSVSRLRSDPAIGLTQIRPGAWSHKIKRQDLNSVENQVKYGAEILHTYYKALGDRRGTVQAYNLGLAGYRKGRTNPRYVVKYEKELAQYQF